MDIFLIVPPGLEEALAREARAKDFEVVQTQPGGVTASGTWQDVWRANLILRGATRVLVRIGAFRAMHLAQLDKRARKFPWGQFLPQGAKIKVETTCRKSRIYHAGAAAQRIETALKDTLGATIAADAPFTLKARIEDDLCTFSLDTSGDALHKRGHKEFVGKAPLRENMAALMLGLCGFDGTQPVVDPMCGSGTFVIEAAEIACGLQPGRSRPFAFQQMATFDQAAYDALRQDPKISPFRAYGFDRDTGAIKGATANAARAGVQDQCVFAHGAVSDLRPPEGPPGLVMCNPPYGARIGNRKLLFGLYAATGEVLRRHFKGWRVGIVTSDGGLAKAMDLPFLPNDAPIAHGGLKVNLWRTDALV